MCFLDEKRLYNDAMDIMFLSEFVLVLLFDRTDFLEVGQHAVDVGTRETETRECERER
jgi:hypothetical protein